MRFQLPQFIEIESKIIGPFTLKQFLWIASGASILFLLFSVFQLSLTFFVLALPVLGIFLSFAFLKIEGMPLLNYVAYMLSYVLNPKKYVFKKDNNNLKINNLDN
jgi:hypothetical protein